MKSGYQITSTNENAVTYLKQRIRAMEFDTSIPFDVLLNGVAQDLVTYSNAFLVKSRVDKIANGLDAKGVLDTKPVGGYFRMDPTTVTIKRASDGTIDDNLKDYDWANVVVVSLLAISDIPDYPVIQEDISLGETVFTIILINVTDEQVYFAEYVDNKVMVENLLNFDMKGTLKPVFVDKIIRYMLYLFNFNEFIGKPYNKLSYTRIQNKLWQYLERIRYTKISNRFSCG